ncbi:MAG: CBASS oligonucleotide cyclase [Sedimentisphaerales bacterium]
MGGSGGYFSRGFNPEQQRARLRDAEIQRQDLEYLSKVGEVISRALSQYNNRDANEVGRILDEILAELGRSIEGAEKFIFGGSVAKHTYVDGLSDIDALIVMSPEDAETMTPAQLRKRIADIVRARYGDAAVQEGTLAVTVRRGEHIIQLLPALRCGSGVKIPNSDASDWSRIRPKAFARVLAQANQRLNGNLVPTIKLAKAIIDSLPEQRRLQGYHTEALALRVFEGYTGTLTPKAMLQHFFDSVPTKVLHRIQDVTGQSQYVDEYFGDPNSVRRRIVADALGRIARIMKNADGARSVERWERFF